MRKTESDFLWWWVCRVFEGEMYFSSLESMSEKRAGRLKGNMVKRACSLRKTGLALSV